MTAGEYFIKRKSRAGRIRCTAFWTVFILAVTLFPYDPVLRPVFPGILARLDLRPIGNPGDFLVNILLFIPWGFCMAGMPAARRSLRRQTLIALGLGFALSGMVELLQLGLPSRNPALADILANLFGVVAGVRLKRASSERRRFGLSSFGTIITQTLTIQVLVGLLALHLVLVFGLFRFADHRSSFANWDPGYHLNLGNENTGDRPWRGSLGEVRLWQSVLPREDIERLLNGKIPSPGLEVDLLWLFDPSQPMGPGSPVAHAPDLVWRPAPPARAEQEAAWLSADHWLASIQPAASLSAALQHAGRFTLSVVIQIDDTTQTGPGRIVSLSADPLHRNFTLGQEGPDLVFRLRTPFTGLNGSDPAMIVPDVFAEAQRRHLVVTYDGATLAVYPGSGEFPMRFNLRYAGVFTGMGFRFNPADQTGYKAVFWGLVWLPPLVILAKLTARWQRSPGAERGP